MSFLHFSANEAEDGSGPETFRNLYEPVMNVFIDRISDQPMSADLRVRILPNVAIGAFTLTPLKGTRTLSHIAADGDDDLNIGICRAGRAGFMQKGRPEAEIQPGAAYLWDNDRPGINFAPEKVSMINLSIPRAVLAPSVVDMDRIFNNGIEPSAELLLLANYADTLTRDLGFLSPESEALAALHLRDLATVALGATRDAAEIARGRGLRAARLKSIKIDIEENLNSDRLTLENIAVRHGISPRYVRALFEMEDTSFTDYVLLVRLNRAHRMLTDPRLLGCSISTIAFEVGFNDLSYFGRAFRRRYGMTPSDARNLTLRSA